MNPIVQIAYARAGLLGNPSDGYGGKTIAFVIRDFSARVELRPSQEVVFRPGPHDGLRFESVDQFVSATDAMGIYGGVRLLKSATLRFVRFARRKGVTQFKPFEVSFATNIPPQVGLAGSSAIVVAMLKALAIWNQVDTRPDSLASMALAAETDLGIAAGLQDRVVQSYDQMVYMDFSNDVMKDVDHFRVGQYELMDGTLPSRVYVAYALDQPESTEVLHNELRRRFEQGEPQVIATLEQIAQLASEGKRLFSSGETARLNELIDANFDLRRTICKLNPQHVKMVETARRAGCSAKYCGSGGAIVGMYPDEQAYQKLVADLASIGCSTLKPDVA